MLEGVRTLDNKYPDLFGSNEDNSLPTIGTTRASLRQELFSRWNWYATVDELTGGQVWREDGIFEWPVIRFLNRLAYMKDKGEMEVKMSRLK